MVKKKDSEKKEEKKQSSKKLKDLKERIGEGFGITGFVLGVESFIFALLVPLIGIVLAINGIVFCAIQQKEQPTKKSKTGLILNIIALIVNVIVWIVSIILLDSLQNGVFPA